MKTSVALILFGLVLFFVTPRAALGESPSVVAADEVMVKIRLGLPAEYDNVVIKGNLTSERLGMSAKQILRIPFEVKMPPSDEPMQANSSIMIKNSTIDGKVDFNNTVFHKKVSFENTLFVENASFRYSTFDGDATFARSMFMKTGSFTGSRFNGTANFSQTYFNEPAFFIGTQF
ncbi:MAG TPA: pentapeptide repeat-containing protein, partial [Methanotrichaceae archaeon]|nr:pentapeptide repeat-containing protein [Methanotrichaceae archaeon]